MLCKRREQQGQKRVERKEIGEERRGEERGGGAIFTTTTVVPARMGPSSAPFPSAPSPQKTLSFQPTCLIAIWVSSALRSV